MAAVLASSPAAAGPTSFAASAAGSQSPVVAYLPVAGHGGATASPPPNPRWRQSNDGLASWSVVGLQVAPGEAHAVYALTASHGLFRSPDGGGRWVAENAGLPAWRNVIMGYLYGNLLTMDPNDAGILYANFGGRPYKFRLGEGWIDISRGIDACPQPGIVGITVDPQDSRHIFAAHVTSRCPGGIYESHDADADAALTWTHIASSQGSGDIGNDAWTLAIDPTNPSRLFSAPPYLGFLYSTNGGHYWHRATPLGEGLRHGSVVAVHPAKTNRVILGHPGGVHVGEYEVTGDLLDWTWLKLPETDWGHVWDLDIAPSEPDTALVASNAGLFGSTDGGTSWHAVGSHQGLFTKSVAFDPRDADRVYVGTGTGLYRSTNGGADLEDITGTLPPEMEVRSTAISASDPQVYYCGLYGVAFCRSDDRGRAWQCRANEPGVARTNAIQVDPADSDVVLAGLERVLRSTDGGASWTEVLNPGPGRQFSDFYLNADGTAFAAAIYVVTADEIYAELYRSADRGVTWEGPIEGFTHGSIAVGPIVRAPGGTLYVASYDHLRRSTDGGLTWTRLAKGLAGDPYDRWVDGLAVDPVEPNRLYASSRSDRLFASTDGGDTWSLLDSNPPPLPGRIAIDQEDHTAFYVFGLYGWRRYSDYGAASLDMPMAGLDGPYTHFRRTALQDPTDPRRFVTGDPFAGFLIIELPPGSAGNHKVAPAPGGPGVGAASRPIRSRSP